ncbi:PulJ/GspJ family protein [Calidithermus chliarophilus]|uniref:PulJ/GspJ family protein n=1 Tax=Calidithermus chliarophilus TaxID=52023 RepID=UPI0004063262|nr:prepilin-type N-terminal cleavage/methylation domain-containing protein [Calidithermus chliarophilus]
MRRARGFTLIEILVALAVLITVTAIAYNGMIQSLQTQSDQEAATNSQAKLRRVMEVITQDLRSAIFGGIINQPYTPTARAVSFGLIDGGAGYPVVNKQDQYADILSAAATASALGIGVNDQLLMVNGAQSIVLPVSGVAQNGQPSQWRLSHSSCRNPLAYAPTGTLVFRIRAMGIRYDPDQDTLYTREGGTEQAMAFDITNFRIDYVYTSSSGTLRTWDFSGGAFPGMTFTDAGTTYTLQRLQVVMEAREISRGRAITRTYTGQVELLNNGTYAIGTVVSCS